ncbi:antibiotic biosynthesis monooxygenase family protein [Streptosporangium sp. NPDC049046]|uniref:antibiotic biosynthesis monooxygenase family protein n=1 Tax=Streptosporangium sp. NPDC049046 TaxID=3155031 RepID=UPI003444603A
MRARIVFLIRVPDERREDFLAAYEKIRYQVSAGVPGHLRDQVCQSATDPEQWLITSEWRELADFLTWEATEEHRELVGPMRECMTEARSLRFLIREETGAALPSPEGMAAVPLPEGTAAAVPLSEGTEDGHAVPGGAPPAGGTAVAVSLPEEAAVPSAGKAGAVVAAAVAREPS